MKIEANALLRVISITNGKGQRLGHYIVDSEKDSLQREKRGSHNDPEQTNSQACDGEAEGQSVCAESTEIAADGRESHLHITA